MKQFVRSALRLATSTSMTRVPLRWLSHADLVPSAIWKRLPVEATFSVDLFEGSSFTYISSSGDAIGRALYWGGLAAWNYETIVVFEKLARQAKVVLDVGANTGAFSMVACAANPQAKVLAFEPIPYICQRIQENIKANGWESRCEAHQVAVSKEEGATQFHLPKGDFPTSGSLHLNGYRGLEGSLIDVEVKTLDGVCSPELSVDLVKIDVEGFEDQVLMGMQRILAEQKPDLIFECNPDGPIDSINSILHQYDYQIFHLQPTQ